MKVFLLLMVLVGMGCTHQKNKEKWDNQIESQNSHSIPGIKSHFKEMINAHTHLSESDKQKIETYLNETLNKYAELKDEQAKIIHLLFQSSFQEKEMTIEDEKKQKYLTKKLKKIYDEKSENVLTFITNVKRVINRNNTDAKFEEDLIWVLRDFR